MVIKKRVNNIFFCIAALVIFTASALAIKNFDLADYPAPFISEQLSNAIIIIGENAKIEDWVCAMGIATSLGPAMTSEMIVLDTEVDNIKAQNIIIVGGPCANIAAAEIMGYPKLCDQDFEPGKAKIKLFQGLEGQGENIALLVAGYAAADTTRACRLLANYDDYDLSGNEIEVAGTILNGIILETVE